MQKLVQIFLKIRSCNCFTFRGLVYISVCIIIINTSYFLISNTLGHDVSLIYKLKGKTIVFPVPGENKTISLTSSKERSLWHFFRILTIKKDENLKMLKSKSEFIMPDYIEKECFVESYNICYYHFSKEDSETLYFIDYPDLKENVYLSPLILVSPGVRALMKV
jgi:hypothetical protein